MAGGGSDGGGGLGGGGDGRGGGDGVGEGGGGSELKHPSRKERARTSNAEARRKASSLLGSFEGGARSKILPAGDAGDDADADGSAPGNKGGADVHEGGAPGVASGMDELASGQQLAAKSMKSTKL